MKTKMTVCRTLNRNYFLMMIILVNVFSSIYTQGQTQNRAWIIMQNSVDFPSNGAPPTITDITLVPDPFFQVDNGYNSIQGPQGNRQFAIAAGYFTDEFGYRIIHNNTPDVFTKPLVDVNANDPNYPVTGGNEVCIIPVPGECTKFYVVSAYIQHYGPCPTNSHPANGFPAPAYTLFDASVLNDNPYESNANIQGHGMNMSPSVRIDKNQPYSVLCNDGSWFIPFDPPSHRLTDLFFGCTKLRQTENERYLFIADNDYLYYSVVNSVGISTAQPIYSLPSFSHTAIGGELEIFDNNNGTYNVAVPVFTLQSVIKHNQIYIITVAITNSVATIVPSPVIVDVSSSTTATTGSMSGIEFSPNGDYIYVTDAIAPNIKCFSTANGNPVTSFYLPSTPAPADLASSQIELGYDQKLYFTTPYNSANELLVSYSAPDAPGNGTWASASPQLTNVYNIWMRANLLGDQIDGEDYSMASAASISPECCAFVTHWDRPQNGPDFTATTSATWTGASNPINGNSGNVVWIEGTLTIPAGVNITIDNMVFYFGTNGKVIIESGPASLPAGRLTLLGTTFTGNEVCQTMWQGVEAWGDPSIGNSSRQGKITMINYPNNLHVSKIMNAVCGIRTSKLNDDNYRGGFIEAHDAQFLRCRTSIVFDEYNGNNNQNYESIIDNCIFAGTQNLWTPFAGQGTADHIFFYKMDGSQVLFMNNNRFSQSNSGISCYDSPDVDIAGADFILCQTGFYSTRLSVPSTQHNIDACHFASVQTSIHIENGIGDVITYNSFNSNHIHNSQAQTNHFYGIFLERCFGEQIISNDFYSNMYGIYIRGTHTSGDGNIENNIFTGCWRGIHAESDCSKMQIKCNDFLTDNSFDYSTQWYIGDRLANQLVIGNGAANTFNNLHSFPNDKDLYSAMGSAGNPNFTYSYFVFQQQSQPARYTVPQITLQPIILGLPNQYCGGHLHLMELAGDDPDTAKAIIDTTLDEGQRENFVLELFEWYRSHRQDEPAVEFLLALDNEYARKLLLPEYIYLRQYNEARHLVDTYNNPQDEESYNYYLLHNILLNWAETGRTPGVTSGAGDKNGLTGSATVAGNGSIRIDSAETATLFAVKESGTTSSMLAGSILRFALDTLFIESNYSDTSLYRLDVGSLSTINFFSGIYPNPASGTTEVTYFIPEDVSFAELNMYDMTGRKLLSKQLKKESKKTLIDLVQWTDGCYIIELNLDNYARERQKLIIQNSKH